MLRPLFAQQYAPLQGGKLGPLLKLALKWWRQALAKRWCETVPWSLATETVELFCVARSTPARVAAVLVVGSHMWYTDWEPTASVIDIFVRRADCQIMALELLAAAVALCKFADALDGRSVRVWTDNIGGEGALRSGAAKASGHNLIVHGVGLFALRKHMGLCIERVPTDDNISDLPRRESYGLMRAMGAVWAAPKLDEAFREPCKLGSISIDDPALALEHKR